MARPFLIDTDAGSDDAVAILMALRHADIDVRAITVVAGNVPLPQGVVNSLYFTELCEVDAPVYAGATGPLLREYVSADWFHGADGLGDWGDRYKPKRAQASKTHAVDVIIETARSTTDLVIVTLGPLTNLALALRKAPDIAPLISRCVVMGGAACTNGNVTPAAEYNIWCDPEAARIVFRSGLPIEMVGWEFSIGEFVLSLDDIDYARGINTPFAEFTIDCNIKGMRGYEIQTGEIGISLPDGVAMAVAIDPSICIAKSQHYVDVECDSELTRGMTVVDKLNLADDTRNKPVWRELLQTANKPSICWDLDASRWKELLYQLLR
ncbi:MAG: nucleoside hydrolase [Chloroflexi bacterium]|nr:nucleoside hydrolase [Chloroflexota bacterium]